MHLMILTTAIFLFSCLGQSSQASCLHNESTFRCVKYVKNYDGDTITVDIPDIHPLLGKNISVRIRGIDTPEIKGSKSCEKETARAAKRLVESYLKRASHIELQNIDRDKYFRILADVVADGKSVSDVLIKNRLATAYDGGTKVAVDWCNRNSTTRDVSNTSP